MPTATLALLLDGVPDANDLGRALSGFVRGEHVLAAGAAHGLTVSAPGGRVAVDVVGRRWDDAPTLARSVAHAYGWDDAARVAAAHTAFAGISVTIDDPSGGPTLASRGETLALATDAARLVSSVPGVLAYFAPSGEVLLGPDRLQQSILLARAAGVPPFDLWSNVRMFRANDGYLVMDTVGLAQLGQSDHEAWIPEDLASPNDIAMWLRNLTALALRGTAFGEGTRAQGPSGIVFQATHHVLSTNEPVRPVFRWRPPR